MNTDGIHVGFILPGDINTPTGGYRYDRRILESWGKAGVCHTLISLPGSYPFPSETEKQTAFALADKICAQSGVVVIDGLAGGAHPGLVEYLSEKLPVAALVHHPLFLESGLKQKTAEHLKHLETRTLRRAKRIITTSPATSRTVASEFDYPDGQIFTVLPGVERGTVSKPSTDNTIRLLCVGSIIARKGHLILIEALSNLKHLDWSLELIGMTSADPELFKSLKDHIQRRELSERVIIRGSVDEQAIEAAYRQSDVFVLPSLYEGYGMAYAEAIVRGIPVIGTTAGAIPETVPQTCGILVEPNDANTLQHALETMISNKAVRNRFREGALASEPDFPTWERSAAEFFKVLEDMR